MDRRLALVSEVQFVVTIAERITCRRIRNLLRSCYHRRSCVEAVFSAIKRKFGSAVRSIAATARINEVLAKVLLHNLTCIVHAVTEHGIANDVLGKPGKPPTPSSAPAAPVLTLVDL